MILSEGADLKSRKQWWWDRTILSPSSCSSDVEPRWYRHDDSVVGDSLNDQNGLPDGIRIVVSQSLHLSGYLLNHGRRWHAFLINVQVHSAKTASGTTVAIADKAKVYILMSVSTTWPHCQH